MGRMRKVACAFRKLWCRFVVLSISILVSCSVVTRHPLRLGFFTFFLLGSFLVLVSSCTRWMGRELHGQRLFALTYGDAENQLHFPDAGYAQSQSNIQLCMKDGIFYVAHAATGKVMRMTSFGDVLAVIFNPEKNAMTPQF
ncbi:hypothetical protein QJS90_05725, partial [Treponema pallidum]